jgi:hypothetical protein
MVSPHCLAQPLGCLKIIDAKDLLHPCVGNEGRGPRAVKIAGLAHILQNWPKLEIVTHHQPHIAPHSHKMTHNLHPAGEGQGLQAPYWGSVWRPGRLRPLCASFDAKRLRHQKTQPTAVAVQTIEWQHEKMDVIWWRSFKKWKSDHAMTFAI